MTHHREHHAGAERYVFDFKYCTPSRGWAQVDTEQDAAYYGLWANPFDLKIFEYCEGDTTATICDSPQEFESELERLWPILGVKGIDCLCNERLIARFQGLALGHLTH